MIKGRDVAQEVVLQQANEKWAKTRHNDGFAQFKF